MKKKVKGMKLFSRTKKDFRIDTFRAGGKGGQKQNKTDSGVRITDIETGLVAESREERSQKANKRKAFMRLADLLIEHYKEEDRKDRALAAGFGAEDRIRTYHEPDDRVVDHETGEQHSYKQTVGKGDLATVIETRLLKKRAEDFVGSGDDDDV